MKFKVGDKVRVREDLEAGTEYGGDEHLVGEFATSNHLQHMGQVVTISGIPFDEEDIYWIKEDDLQNKWKEEMFEGLADEHYKTDAEVMREIIEGRNHKPTANTGDPWIDNLPEEYYEMYEEEDAIRPQHYRKGEIDLYESWYRTRPFNEFRAIMESIAERYMKRDKENRVEDLEKAIYTLERLKEYEELEGEE